MHARAVARPQGRDLQVAIRRLNPRPRAAIITLPRAAPRGALQVSIRHLKPTPLEETNTAILMRLTSWVEPGLYEREFHSLMEDMRQCTCGMIMAQDVFNEHRCKENMIIAQKKAKTE